MRSFLLGLACAAAFGCSNSEPAVDPERSYLSDDERLRLFDLERADFLLGLALRPFHDAIRSGDSDGIRANLAQDFRCDIPALPAGALEPGAPYAAHALGAAESTDADGFLRWVSGLGRAFEEIDTVSFARYRNSEEIIAGPRSAASSAGAFRIAGSGPRGAPVELAGTFLLEHDGFERLGEEEDVADQDVDVSHWIRALRLSDVTLVSAERTLFEEVTDSCGIETESLHDNWIDKEHGILIFTGGVYLGDVNGDDHVDLFVGEMLHSRLYWGDGEGGFTESGWEPEVPMIKLPDGRTRVLEPHAALFDATGNGKVDLLHAGTIYTWSARRAAMVEVKGSTKLPNADASLCDYDRDGLVDVYFTNSGGFADKRQDNVWFDDERTNGRSNQLFRNLGGGKFKNVTRGSNASPAFGRTFATLWFYADDDDWPDLFGANEFGRNVFIINNGDGTFREVADIDPVFGGFSMGASSGDMDGDGMVDIYLSNMYSKAGQRVYHHLDLDIYPENARRMFVASVTGNRLYQAQGDLTFKNTSAYSGGYAVGWGFSGAMFDLDLDGWLDLYAPCGYISVDRGEPDG